MKNKGQGQRRFSRREARKVGGLDQKRTKDCATMSGEKSSGSPRDGGKNLQGGMGTCTEGNFSILRPYRRNSLMTRGGIRKSGNGGASESRKGGIALIVSLITSNLRCPGGGERSGGLP